VASFDRIRKVLLKAVKPGFNTPLTALKDCDKAIEVNPDSVAGYEVLSVPVRRILLYFFTIFIEFSSQEKL